MQVRVLVEITDDASPVLEEIASFMKVTSRAEDLGLSLADAKGLLVRLQRRIVEAQAEGWTEAHRGCGTCGQRRRIKGSYPVVFRTLFGDMRLRSCRLHRCPCEDDGRPPSRR